MQVFGGHGYIGEHGIEWIARDALQTDLHRRILRSFVGRGLLESGGGKEMVAYQHSGFSVDIGLDSDEPPHRQGRGLEKNGKTRWGSIYT